ncbi:hypothetical protein [Lysinibacillus xylanilyticus]|uniref:hypothetical protein n=1 Tax=Lysinibacillus xylanilyticus TaxID=582475 RepID=UPI003D02B016
MDVIKLIKENIQIFFTVALSLFFIHIIIKPVYTSLRNKFMYTKFWKFLTKTNISRTITYVVLSVVLLASFTAFQQKYSIIQLGKKDNYIALVISILTLYGILYTFLQFTIGYALQNKNDKYWGRSITKDFLLKRLGFEIFKSTFFKILLLYAVIYPTVSKAIILGIENFNIPLRNTIPQAFWEVSVSVIYILYAYLFLQSLSSMKMLYSIQERRNSRLEWKIEKAVVEKYERVFEYSYKNNRDYFINELFEELEPLDQNEQTNMLMYILGKTFSSESFLKNQRGGLFKLFKRDDYLFSRAPFYLDNLFNSLYEKIEEYNIQLSLRDLLDIYRWHDNAINNSLRSSNKHEGLLNGDFLDEVISVYSRKNNFSFNEDCAYFKLPSIIENRITSYQDIEEIHSYIIKRQGFKFVLEAYKFNSSEHKNSYDMMTESYYQYFYNMLDFYGDYLSDLKYNYYSGFFRTFGENMMDEQESEIIYDYLINMEFTEHNKDYAVFLTNKLDFKYKASFIFYNILYTGPSRKWEKEILLFKHIINRNRIDESVRDEHILEFVCNKIKNSNIGHRIDSNLIEWIIKNITISKLNKEVLNRCLSEQHMSYDQFLKLKYIFTENHYCSSYFYDVDFDIVNFTSHPYWEIDFLKDMLKTPELLNERFFSQHLFYYCQKISYGTEHFQSERNFSLFLINRSFQLSENQLIDLLDNRYLGKGIIEFLILQLDEPKYKYLTEGVAYKSFSTEVKKIIRRANMSVNSYIDDLVSQANECRDEIISDVEKNEIVQIVEKMIKTTK